jgi:hypothetical protein
VYPQVPQLLLGADSDTWDMAERIL